MRLEIDTPERVGTWSARWVAEWAPEGVGGELRVLIVDSERETVVLRRESQSKVETEAQLLHLASRTMMALGESWWLWHLYSLHKNPGSIDT